MLRVAICDDDAKMAAYHESIVERCISKNKVLATTHIYTSGEFLLFDIQEKEFFDLVLLDIEMPNKGGMEIAKDIKEISPNTVIIFVTSHRKYAIDSFELSIFRYIPKDCLKEKLDAALTEAFKFIEIEKEKAYIISTHSRFEKIFYRDIIYILKDGKNSVITTTTGESKVRKSLAQVYEELGAKEFIFIDRGCIVNVIHIMKVKNADVILKNKECLPISRTRMQDVKVFINEYWSNII